MDVRLGGVCRLTTSGPDGVDSPTKIVYREVTKPERLVYDHGDAGEPGNSRVTVTFAEEGRETRVTLRILFPSAAARETMATKYHAGEVVNQSLNRVGERLAETMAGSPMANDLVITRVFDAPRETMFKAWTEVERLKRWWGPKNFTNPVCEMDARPGGAIRIHMRAPDGAVYPMTGVVREIAAPERMVFGSAALDENGHALFEVLSTVTFAERGGKTEMTLRLRVTKATAKGAPYMAGMDAGWRQSLERLASEVDR